MRLLNGFDWVGALGNLYLSSKMRINGAFRVMLAVPAGKNVRAVAGCAFFSTDFREALWGCSYQREHPPALARSSRQVQTLARDSNAACVAL